VISDTVESPDTVLSGTNLCQQKRRRAELAENETSMTAPNDIAIRRALEAAGVEFIDGNGGGPGVRLRKRQGPRAPVFRK
jgi:hypothetical protein